MNPNQTIAFKYIEQAQQAMKAGDLQSARQLATQAAQTAPELEEVWLILAALVSPRESVVCLRKALTLNPASERAQKGLLWAQKRLQQETESQAAPQPPAAEEKPGRILPVPAVENPAPASAPESGQEENPVEAAPPAESDEPAQVTSSENWQAERPLEAAAWQEPEEPASEASSENWRDETPLEAVAWQAAGSENWKEEQPAEAAPWSKTEESAPAESFQSWEEEPSTEAEPGPETKETSPRDSVETRTEESLAETAAAQPQEQTPLPPTQPLEAEKTSPMQTAAVLEPKTSPKASETPRRPVLPAKTLQSQKKTGRSSTIFIVLLVLLLCLGLAWMASQTSSVAAFFTSSAFTGREHGPAWAQSNLSKPDAGQNQEAAPVVEPTATLIFTPASDLALPPTPTETPVPSATPLPTATASPTLVPPTQTETQQPTATPPASATDLPTATTSPEMVFVDSASPTPLPTDTAMPVPTAYLAPTPQPPTAGTGGNTAAASGEHWIDVDLTHQMVYAYAGNTVVNSFLVSTGTWQYPTVTGQYHVYIKYRYKDMSGPGYYLPNVPFTMFFYQGYALHGTYWHSNFGTPMSHGCVNLTIPDSEWVYNFSTVGTLVNVHY
jgi:lipoprotein-anchoring transpeptidase ErfK/SrfK